MEYKVVYEYAFPGTNLIHIIPLTLFALLGFGVAYYLRRKFKSFSLGRQYNLFVAYVVGGVASLIMFLTLLKAPSIIREEKQFKELVATESYDVVVGKTADYALNEYSGQFFESFNVGGINFEYSDYVSKLGFHKTAKSGGPINGNGLQVRISYVSRDSINFILKLEMRQDEILD